MLTGGQTGVDTLAARAALAAGLPVHLAFPRGMRQEDGPVRAERLAGLRSAVLHELQAAEFAERTWACAGLADVVILVDPAGGDGCAETVRAAGRLGRPLLDLTRFTGEARVGVSKSGAGRSPAVASGPPGPGPAVETAVRTFLSENSPHVVLLAGCRASLLAGTGTTAAVTGVLDAVMRAAAGVSGGRQARPPAGPAS